MAYSPIGVMDLYQIVKRWHAGYNFSEIARVLVCTRKTVRHYVRAAEACGLSRQAPLPAPDELARLLLEKARQIGPAMHTYIERILEPHARINMRKAQGMLALARHYSYRQMESAAEEALLSRQYRYQEFKKLLAEEESAIPVSEHTITCSAEYLIH